MEQRAIAQHSAGMVTGRSGYHQRIDQHGGVEDGQCAARSVRINVADNRVANPSLPSEASRCSPEQLLTSRHVPAERASYFEALCAGGYPAVQRMAARTRRRWFARYVQTVLAREIKLMADIRRAGALMSMMRYLAATTAQELVLSTTADRAGIDRGTAQSYLPWLETVFLVHRVPAWSRSLTAKVVNRPKVYSPTPVSPPPCWRRTRRR